MGIEGDPSIVWQYFDADGDGAKAVHANIVKVNIGYEAFELQMRLLNFQLTHYVRFGDFHSELLGRV